MSVFLALLASFVAAHNSSTPELSSPPPRYLNAVTDCGADPSGTQDSTLALQACINQAYGHTIPRVPVFLPFGRYLVNDTLTLTSDNLSGDDGINVCPGRFLPHHFIGQALSTSTTPSTATRPSLYLAPSSPGYSGSKYKEVVRIRSANGEGVDMNNLFKGVDIDLTAPGNPMAVGVSHPGAQGATVTDVTVTASPTTFACFAGLNGAGGMHSNIKCIGGQYGLFIDDSQPVPSAAGVTLINQSISAIKFFGQETLSLVGAVILTAPGATGPAITTQSQGMSLVDVSITCGGSYSPTSTAVSTTKSLYAQNLYVSGCGVSITTPYAAQVPGPPLGQWQQIHEYAAGVDNSPWYKSSAIYLAGVRAPEGTVVSEVSLLPTGTTPPTNLLLTHVWEELTFPDGPTNPLSSPKPVFDAIADCGAKGDNSTDDTVALQACLTTHTHVFLPPGLFRISDTLDVPPGGSLVGMGNGASYLLAASGGFPKATPGTPLPMLRTSDQDDPAVSGLVGPTTLAFLGVGTWHHLPNVFTLDWRSRHPGSLWRVNFEFRDCECLWLGAFQGAMPGVPCSLPSNATTAKSLFRGLGRVHSFVNDDTGVILNTGAPFRSIRVADTAGFAGESARTRFYSLNLEHAQSEANGEVVNASFVTIYSIKGEGNLPLLWLRGGVRNVSVLGLGGGISPFAFNRTLPSDFTPLAPSLFRVDEGVVGVKFAALLDHGYGAKAPYWPPSGGGCKWEGGYKYPGTAIPFYPFSTFPNVTMWNCWFGEQVATTYW